MQGQNGNNVYSFDLVCSLECDRILLKMLERTQGSTGSLHEKSHRNCP